jgi:hypothetical protein
MRFEIRAVGAAFLALAFANAATARGGGHGSGHSSHSLGHSSSHTLASGYRGPSHASTHMTAAGSGGSHTVRGYTRKDGTYVAPSGARNPNHSKLDNYSIKGNSNPYSGKQGTKEPDGVGQTAKSLRAPRSPSFVIAPTISINSRPTAGRAPIHPPLSTAQAPTPSGRGAAAEPATQGVPAPSANEERPTARCVDGTMTFAQNKSSACGTRGGVADWFR